MAKIFGLLFVAVISCCVFKSATADIEPNGNETCGTTYSQANGIVRYYKNGATLPENITCDWTIKFNETKTAQEVFLVFEEFRLLDKDFMEIFENVNGTEKPLNFGKFYGQHGPFSVLTGVPSIIVHISTTVEKTTRKFQMHYYTTPGCTHELVSVTTGTFSSPIYDAKRNTSIDCKFSIGSRGKDSFKLATVVTPLKQPLDNLTLTVKGSEFADKTYNGVDLPREFISGDINLNVTVKPNGKPLQQVQFAYEIVNKECSGTYKLDVSSSTHTFENPTSTEASVSETPNLNCRALVFTEEKGVAALTVTVDAHALPGPLDLLQIQNGIDRQAPSILQLTSSSEKEWEDQYVMTNRQNLSISLVSTFPSPKMNVSITIGLVDSGGYFENNGTISVSNQKDLSVFLLRVDPKKQVRLDLEKPTYKEGKLKFFYNFEKGGTPFAEFTDALNASGVISPSPLMMVQATGFSKETFTATFKAVERGCFAVSTDNVGSYNLFGNCSDTCTWTIAGKSNASDEEYFKLHFSSLVLNPNDTLRIVQNNLPVASVVGPLRHVPDFDLDANSAVNVIVQRNCSRNGTTSVVADYAFNTKCEYNVTLETGKSFVVYSPGYPNGYPVSSNCKWNFFVKENDLIHVSFESLRLGWTDHEVTLERDKPGDEKLVAKFVGPTGSNDTLPRDYIVQASNLTVRFFGGAYNRSIAAVAYQFRINVTAAGCGGQMIQESGNFSIPPAGKENATDSKLCFWLVGVGNKTKSIILFNSTSPSSPKGYLEIHEGSSVRDPPNRNLTGVNLTSRFDRMLFVYRNPNATAGPSVLIRFKATPCNASCENGVCMHPEWMCNNINDCGDWTDERYCNSTCPTPAPTPSPQPTPSGGVSGVSGGTLAGGIFGALVIGALLGFLVPNVVRRYRSRPSTEYSTLIGASG